MLAPLQFEMASMRKSGARHKAVVHGALTIEVKPASAPLDQTAGTVILATSNGKCPHLIGVGIEYDSHRGDQ